MIFVVNVRCDVCGRFLRVEDPNADGDAFLDAATGKIRANCKNIQVCIASRVKAAS